MSYCRRDLCCCTKLLPKFITTQGYMPMEDLTQLVTPRVTPEMNEALARPFTAEEVRVALFQMAPLKAPGVDGFTIGFFQRSRIY